MHEVRVQIIKVDSESEGQRLDNFLLRHLKGLPRSRVYRIVRKGEVRLNGRRAKPRVRLKIGDEVRVPPVRDLGYRAKAAGNFEDLDSLILHEDSHLIVLNKPAGMAVHGGSGVAAGVIESLRRSRSDLKECELAHRLDRDTSGCLMIAKRRSYLRLLQDALRRPGTISKQYVAVVHGRLSDKNVTVDEPLLTISRAGYERYSSVDRSGKSARTLFRRLAYSNGVSAVEAKPLTGRTHQIRAHCQWLGCPIVGDSRYGDKVADRELNNPPKRMLLHARRLDIPALGNRGQLRVIAPLAYKFEAFLESTLGFGIKNI